MPSQGSQNRNNSLVGCRNGRPWKTAGGSFIFPYTSAHTDASHYRAAFPIHLTLYRQTLTQCQEGVFHAHRLPMGWSLWKQGPACSTLTHYKDHAVMCASCLKVCLGRLSGVQGASTPGVHTQQTLPNCKGRLNCLGPCQSIQSGKLDLSLSHLKKDPY